MENNQTPLPVVSSGIIHRFQNFISKYVEARNVDIWLPAGYNANTKYAVLYMHDGQMLFDPNINWNHEEWGIDETLGMLMAQNKIRPCIVVGIWNNGKYRHAEFFPEKALAYLDEHGKAELFQRYYGSMPQADNYLKFIINELKPEVDRNFSTSSGQGDTFIGGSSMGALISLYGICEYPDFFGGAACLSTHWIGIDRAENNPIPFAVQRYMQSHVPPPQGHLFYFDYGSATLDALYKPFQLAANNIMRTKGYTADNWITDEFPGEDHSENSWNRRFHIPAEFLLGYKQQ